MADIEQRTFDFLSILTLLVVLLYVGLHAWGLIAGRLTFADLTANIGPMAGLLLGYWVRGAK